MALERVEGAGHEREGAASGVRLRRVDVDLSTLPPLQGAVDGELLGLEVYVLPPEGEGFTAPEAEAQHDDGQGLPPVALGSGENSLRLLSVEGVVELRGGIAWSVDQRGRV